MSIGAAVAETTRVLQPVVARDWTVPAGSLSWSCWQTAAHIAHDLLAYATQVSASPPTAYLPLDLRVRPGASPGELLATIGACGGLLQSAVATADPESRAWHFGPCDPAGFEAMGVAEILLHTYDITQGLGIQWMPPATMCEPVLQRLFPNVPNGPAADVLLWATGRGELPGHARVTSWVWKAALD
jgi:mycothiol maleylpyruvate isomerase-like protein